MAISVLCVPSLMRLETLDHLLGHGRHRPVTDLVCPRYSDGSTQTFRRTFRLVKARLRLVNLRRTVEPGPVPSVGRGGFTARALGSRLVGATFIVDDRKVKIDQTRAFQHRVRCRGLRKGLHTLRVRIAFAKTADTAPVARKRKFRCV